MKKEKIEDYEKISDYIWTLEELGTLSITRYNTIYTVDDNLEWTLDDFISILKKIVQQ